MLSGLFQLIDQIKTLQTGKSVDHYYNMVGLAVAMVISTMHEKACIDSHNVRKFEKSSKIQLFTHLVITMMRLRKYHRHYFFEVIITMRPNYSEINFLQYWAKNSHLNYH